MEVKLIVVESAIKWLVGGELLNFIKDAVAKVNDEDIAGEEKRAYVKSEALKLFSNFGTLFINLAIEVAVVLLRAELAEQAEG